MAKQHRNWRMQKGTKKYQFQADFVCHLPANEPQRWGYELAAAVPKAGRQHAFKASLEIRAALNSRFKDHVPQYALREDEAKLYKQP